MATVLTFLPKFLIPAKIPNIQDFSETSFLDKQHFKFLQKFMLAADILNIQNFPKAILLNSHAQKAKDLLEITLMEFEINNIFNFRKNSG